MNDALFPQTGKSASSPVNQQSVQQTIRHIGDSAGLDSKYFERRDDSTPVYGLSSNVFHKEFSRQTKPSVASAYFSA
ncbi:hypothetical protein VZT92_022715 [Zoarces viviparus]|uniref:Uncharacterized protein n=1 Tax=Zoarces viviparus TaxID=48416 RepID=A0AAW1EEF3_ZOAVI